jgi:TfoX/Sxy family transcriptional regulator of competence genes
VTQGAPLMTAARLPVGMRWQHAGMADELWQDLVQRTEGGPVTRGMMFGAQGLRTGRKFFAIWWHEHLVVKLPADRLQELVASGQGELFEPMAGRPMNGWALLRESAEWDPLVTDARTYVESQQAPSRGSP